MAQRHGRISRARPRRCKHAVSTRCDGVFSLTRKRCAREHARAMTLHQWIVGGLLAWAALSIAFGPELVRAWTRLRDAGGREAARALGEPAQRPSVPPGV
jgi:hypothetical protein